MTTEPDTATTVRRHIDVDVPPERAFQVFTERFDAIKPREYNLLRVPVVETVLEARPGGAVYDRGADGSECRWGRVLEVEPPHRLVMSWDITPRWQVETDPGRCSEVEITFAAVGPGRTRVTVEHRHLDRHGEGWEAEAASVAEPGGWPVFLSRFAAAVGA